MKKLILFFSLIIVALGCNAQNEKPGSAIPPYRILKTDSTWATPANLKHRRTVLIYFSPDCPHCQHLTMQMREKIKQFGDAQIVMITWSNNYDIRAIKSFVKEFNLTKYRNIIVGTEGYTYVVQKYYKIETTPYIAVFNANGTLSKAFRKAPEQVDTLIKAVKAAKS
ncbi:MAG TPA: thioredoxin-like domain-containing protein [Mucilaginibacter sp.]|jgi:Redoxin.